MARRRLTPNELLQRLITSKSHIFPILFLTFITSNANLYSFNCDLVAASIRLPALTATITIASARLRAPTSKVFRWRSSHFLRSRCILLFHLCGCANDFKLTI